MSEPDDFPIDDTIEVVLDLPALIDDHIDKTPTDFENDIPTMVELRRVCPGCGHNSIGLDDTDQPPASHDQAWRNGGPCRGNKTWFWCSDSYEHRVRGVLTIMASAAKDGSMDVLFFPDRRLVARPVAVERRRGLPPGTPKGGK